MSRLFFVLVVFLSLVAPVAANEGEAIRRAVATVAPRLVRIDTIGGREKVGDEWANEGTCTGFLLDNEGFVITSAFHFLHEPSSILLRFHDGSKRVARKVCTDRNRMLTLLKIEERGVSFATALSAPIGTESKQEIEIGSACIAVGVALSPDEPNVALGIVSGKDRIWGKSLQTDAAIGPNNYGGPLIDLDGKLLGLLVPLSMTSRQLAAGTEMYDAGVGMAIPFEDIQALLPRMKQGVDLEPVLPGFHFNENRIFIGEPVIDAVQPHSAAAAAGLEKNDRILRINDTEITTALQVTTILHSCYAGDTLEIRFRRGDNEQEVLLQTGRAPPGNEKPGAP